MRRAEEFRSAIAATPISTGAGPIHVTCSFGVAENFSDWTPEELINKADEAMYCAKRAGRNRVHASPPLNDLTNATTESSAHA